MPKKKAEKQLELIGTDGGELLEQLEERVEKAVELVGDLRDENSELRRKLEKAESRVAELEAGSERLTELEKATEEFEEQKARIRGRIESLLERFEQLEEA